MNTRLFIAGQWRESISGSTFPTVNPATGELLADVSEAGRDDIDLAVRAARSAYKEVWGEMDPSERARFLYKLAEIIESNSGKLSRLETIDVGKPLSDSRDDILSGASFMRFFAGLTDKVRGSTIPVQQGYFTYTQREPYGVIGAIIPWNYPFYIACSKVAPILAMGNTCVLKPAEEAPLSSLELACLAQQAGIPEGVFNVVPGYGHIAGAALAEHMDVDKLTFTGSTEVGRLVMESAAKSNLKALSLELGGKSPMIVFPDANIERAVEAAVFSVFYNQGQTCTAATRLLIHSTIADEVAQRVCGLAERIRVGNPLDPNINMGAIISSDQYHKIQSFIESGLKEGAVLRFGGKAPDDDSLKKGFFMLPTVFGNVKQKMNIAQEEIFGPVLSLIQFETEEEAVDLANDVRYGLAASVWTCDSARVHRIARSINSGIVWVNCVFGENPAAPFGGFKQSGFGKEYGVEAGLEYSRLKTVWVNLADTALSWVK